VKSTSCHWTRMHITPVGNLALLTWLQSDCQT